MVESVDEVVIGIDGGGTYTRVMVVDFCGHVLSYVEKGASSIYKDLNAAQNVQQAIEEALNRAGKHADQARMLTAGIAGFDSDSDYEWVQPLTAVEGLHCRKEHVNDAVVAHSGALITEPGIIVIAGTGSIIYAMTEEGQQIRNYDLHHYATSAARFLAYDATYELLAGNSNDSDLTLVKDMLQFWKVSSVEELSQLARHGFVADQRERNKIFAQLAPTITNAALHDSQLAQLVCDRAIHQIIVGVELLASYFSHSEVKVSFIGGVANSHYFQQQLTARMKAGNNRSYLVMQPAFSPVAGAVLLALKHLNIPMKPEILNNLLLHPCSKQY